jgi:hypothetical protein
MARVVVSTALIVVVLLALGVLLALWARSAWKTRGVDFVHQAELQWEADAAAGEFLDRVIPVLVHDGYSMVAHGGRTTVFEHRFLPAWTVLVALFFFPFGLIALLHRARETIVIVSGDRFLALHGSCSKEVADFVVAAADDVATHPAYAR